jgi:hypothetical protein
MFRSRDEELIIKKHRHQEMLALFRKTLATVARLKLLSLRVHVSAQFQGGEFGFEITVFNDGSSNVTLAIYDFWEVEDSEKLVKGFISAIKTDDFETVKSAERR